MAEAKWTITETRPGVFVGELRDESRLHFAIGGDSREAVERMIRERADYLKKNGLTPSEDRPPVKLRVVD